MSENILRTKSMDFAVQIINLVKSLKENCFVSDGTRATCSAFCRS